MEKGFIHEVIASPGTSAGLGFIGVLVLIGIMTSVFLLWSLSCPGGAACNPGALLLLL